MTQTCRKSSAYLGLLIHVCVYTADTCGVCTEACIIAACLQRQVLD